MVALDCLPFHTITFSDDIKKGFAALGYKVPQSTFGICTAEPEFAQDVKVEKKKEMLCL